MLRMFVILLVSLVKAITELDHLPMPVEESHVESLDFGHEYRNDLGKHKDRDGFPEMETAKFGEGSRREAPKDSLKFLSPRDEIQHYRKYDNKKYMEIYGTKTRGNNAQNTMQDPIAIDFPKLLERNIAYPMAARQYTVFNKDYSPPVNRSYEDISKYFEHNTFYKKRVNIIKDKKKNWTTCDEFVRKSVFHPDDVINAKWLPFYIWSDRGLDVAVVHTFSYPTKKTVQRYKSTYGPYINKINWFEPKLLLKEKREMLLIAGDRRGLFYGIPDQELPSFFKDGNFTYPLMKIRLKIHDPYLAMMYCDTRYATIMAELSTGPDTEQDKILEAKTLNFKGKGKPAFRNVEEEKRLEYLAKQQKIQRESQKYLKAPKIYN